MRPFQHWLHAQVLRWAWQCGTHHVAITLACPRAECVTGVPFLTSVQVYCCDNRYIQDRLGQHMQQACSFSALVGPLTALADHLPRVVGCASGPEKVLTFDPGQALVGPDGQHSHSGLHQPSGQYLLLSPVTTHLPPPSLEIEVSAGHSHTGHLQSCSGLALTTGYASGEWRLHPQMD